MENQVVARRTLAGGKVLVLVHGDITREAVDAIVNAANSHLQHGGGVAGVIVRKGGQVIQEESNRIGFVPVGEVALTAAGQLPAKYVIHAVGPRWGEGDEDAKLASAVRNSLELASDKACATISLPAVSAGIFGFPRARCARIILDTVATFLETHSDTSLNQVRICLFDDPTMKAFQDQFG